jgi:hypothetical protein
MTCFRIFTVRENPEALSPKLKKRRLFGCFSILQFYESRETQSANIDSQEHMC